MKQIIAALLCMALPLLTGSIAGIVTASSVKEWYVTLNKPAFNPPDYVFGPVWTVLYGLMGVSLFLIWRSTPGDQRTIAFVLFGIQLGLNLLWSFIFFYFKQMGYALIEIIFLWAATLAMVLWFYKIDTIASLLQIPYLLWISFATVLNAALFKLN